MSKVSTIILGLIIVLVSAFAIFYNPSIKKEVENTASIKDAVVNYKDDGTLLETIKKYGVKVVMQKLITDSKGGSEFDCHQEAHQVGRMGYKAVGEKAFQQCDGSCHSGCYHGAMESFLSEKGTENLSANIMGVCQKFETSFGLFECLHGVGHGVMAYESYDIPSAIKDCRSLPDDYSQSSCYGGVFMENILTAQGLGASEDQDHSTPWVNKTDPYFPCNKISQDISLQYQCYLMQTSWMLTQNNYNFDKVVNECLGAPTSMIPVCFKSFGRDAAGFTLRDPEKTLDICSKVPKENSYYNQCVEGAVNVIIDFWGPDLNNQASQFCSAVQDVSSKKYCYLVLGARLQELFKSNSDKDNVCKTFETQYQNLCR